MLGTAATDGVAAPPLPCWAPLAGFGVLAAVLLAVVLGLVRPPGPLDQPDLALQRDGLLRDGPVVPERVAGVGFGGRVVVLLFVRRPPAAAQVQEFAQALPAAATLTVVLPEASREELPVPSVVDPGGLLSVAVDLPVPEDGGRGVGYAVVDANRLVRYSTLDPSWPGNGFEAGTLAGAVA